MKLFVGNMNFQTTESDLRSLFEPFGEIASAQIVTDRDTGRSRGFAFVEMPSDDDANKAIAALNGKEVGGRALQVNQARPRPERSPGGGGRGGFSRGGGGGDHRGGSGGRRREPRW